MAFATVGGLAAELLGWFKIRRSLNQGVPDWSKSKLYWFITICMVLAGPFFIFMYHKSGVEFSAILAFNVGESAPLILERLAAQSPHIDPGDVN